MWLRQHVDPLLQTSVQAKKKNEERGLYDIRQMSTFFSEELLDEVYTAW